MLTRSVIPIAFTGGSFFRLERSVQWTRKRERNLRLAIYDLRVLGLANHANECRMIATFTFSHTSERGTVGKGRIQNAECKTVEDGMVAEKDAGGRIRICP